VITKVSEKNEEKWRGYVKSRHGIVLTINAGFNRFSGAPLLPEKLLLTGRGVGKIPINIFVLAVLTVLHVLISLCAQKYQHIIRPL
jgi:hypothetical protein